MPARWFVAYVFLHISDRGVPLREMSHCSACNSDIQVLDMLVNSLLAGVLPAELPATMLAVGI